MFKQNMALDLGNLLGAVANARTAFSKEKSLRSFLNDINNFGVLVKNNFEVDFSGLEDITFRVMDIKLPAVKANTTELHYDGRSIPVVVNYDYEHDFSMTILNDANGYFYTAIANFLLSNASQAIVPNGYTMTIKALTGDENYKGSLITCTGVKLTNIDGLDFGQSSNEVQTFTVSGVMQEFTVTPGAVAKAAGILGAANSLLG